MANQITHEPTDDCVAEHCYIHGVDEPGPGYLVCGECGHLYQRPRDLRRAVRRRRWELVLGQSHQRRRLAKAWWRLRDPRYFLLPIRADRFTFCPECAHDW